MDDDARYRAGDDRGDGAWLTYDQLAETRHISRRAAVRMTQRHRLRRQPGNDGLVRVWVPRDMTEPSQRQSQRDDGGDDARGTAAFEAALAAIREAKDGEIAALRAVIEGLRDSIGRAEDRAGRAETGRNAERSRADAMRDRIEALQEQLAARPEGVDATEAIRQAEAMVDSLREAHAGEVGALKAERHRLATQIDGFATRADQAEARTDNLRARVDVLQRDRDTARAEAQEAAMELRQAEAQQRARGLMARLRAAWRGD